MISVTKEFEILSSIKDAEKKADEINEASKKEREDIISNSVRESSQLLAQRKEEIVKDQEKKINDFMSSAISRKNEKSEEAKKEVIQLIEKGEKNIDKTVKFVMEKFEERI
jgi:vacuolar-type H+-ATPase subunit H